MDPTIGNCVGSHGYCRYRDMPPMEGIYSMANNKTAAVCLGKGDITLVDPKNKVWTTGPMDCNCEEEPQLGTTLEGISFGTGHAVSKCACTMHNALCNRHAYLQPPLLKPITNYIHEEFVNDIQASYLDYYLDVSQETIKRRGNWSNVWNDRFPGSKADANLISLENEQIECSLVDPFGKREVSKDKYPTKGRCIAAYKTKATGATLGPQYYAFQKATAVVSNRYVEIGVTRAHITIASGMDHNQIGGWMDEAMAMPGKIHFYERDGKTWDATMRHEHLDMVNHIMRCCDQELARHNRLCYDTKGRYTHKGSSVFYSVIGTRKSGHNDTSSGNSLINAEIALAAAVDLGLEHVRIIVMGDDMLMAISDPPSNYVESLRKAEAMYGIRPEAGGFTNPLDTTFISARWYPRYDGTYAFGPIICRQLIGLFWTIKALSPQQRPKWVSTVARSFLVPFDGCPIMDAFLRSQITTSEEMDIDKYIKKLRPMIGVDWPMYFLTRYGLTETETKDVENMIWGLKGQVKLINSPLVEAMKPHDMSDPADRPLCIF